MLVDLIQRHGRATCHWITDVSPLESRSACGIRVGWGTRGLNWTRWRAEFSIVSCAKCRAALARQQQREKEGAGG